MVRALIGLSLILALTRVCGTSLPPSLEASAFAEASADRRSFSGGGQARPLEDAAEAAYHESDTFVTLPSRGAQLAGRLTLPAAGSRPYPAVVLVHGSGGMTGRDLMEGPGRRLSEMGLAVLAYDKRGVGQSTGEYTTIGPSNSVRMFDLLAADALADVEVLRRHADIDPARIGLVGFSQAGWIAPLAASRTQAIAFLVLISGPAVSVGEEIYYSRLAGEDPGSEQGVADAEIDRRMREFKGPGGYDPVPVLEKLGTPSFWVLGEKDRSIPVARTLTTLERCRRELGRPITTHVIPGVTTDSWNRRPAASPTSGGRSQRGCACGAFFADNPTRPT